MSTRLICLSLCPPVFLSVIVSTCISVRHSVHLYFCLSLCPPVFLSVIVSTCIFVCHCVHLYFCLSLCPPVFLSVIVSTCLSVCHCQPVHCSLSDQWSEDFVLYLMETIEEPPDEDLEDQLPDSFVNLLLAFNQHFPEPESNLVMKALRRNHNPRNLGEKLMYLVNRGG